MTSLTVRTVVVSATRRIMLSNTYTEGVALLAQVTVPSAEQVEWLKKHYVPEGLEPILPVSIWAMGSPIQNYFDSWAAPDAQAVHLVKYSKGPGHKAERLVTTRDVHGVTLVASATYQHFPGGLRWVLTDVTTACPTDDDHWQLSWKLPRSNVAFARRAFREDIALRWMRDNAQKAEQVSAVAAKSARQAEIGLATRLTQMQHKTDEANVMLDRNRDRLRRVTRAT